MKTTNCILLFIITFIGLSALPSARAVGMDCAPVGSLPNYVAANPPTQYAFKSYDFKVSQKDGSDKTVSVAGHYCEQTYDVKKGVDPMSDLEVHSNYREQFEQLGAKIMFTGDLETVAELTKDGKETWMYVTTNYGGAEVSVVVVNKEPMKQTLLPPSGKDYRLLGHMPGFIAGTPDKKHFDQREFRVHSADGDNSVNVQGRSFDLVYTRKEGVPAPSDLEILGNYRNALNKLGATITYADETNIVAHYDDKDQPIWMEIDSNQGDHSITISVIEEEAFKPTIKAAEVSISVPVIKPTPTPTAKPVTTGKPTPVSTPTPVQVPEQVKVMKTALDKVGHISLLVNFDFNKATLRPDDAPIIDQVITLLKDNPNLKLSIEGHTDNVGGHDYNVQLSKDRAATVESALVKAGIAADRLKSTGYGPDKPVADNATSRGRAQNRRVELVKTK